MFVILLRLFVIKSRACLVMFYRDVRLPPRVIVAEPGTIKRGWPLYKSIIEHTCIYMRVVPMHHKIVSMASYRTGYKISEIFRILSPNFFGFLKFPSFRLLQNSNISV